MGHPVFLRDVIWESLDYLIIDSAAGHRRCVPDSRARGGLSRRVIVSTPQMCCSMSREDAIFARESASLGIIENMSSTSVHIVETGRYLWAWRREKLGSMC